MRRNEVEQKDCLVALLDQPALVIVLDFIAMAMHHRRHNPASGGGANPFTGRSLPSGGRGGGGYHGNSPSLLPSMAKKTVFLVCTLTIFFYVLFAPEYDDVPYEASRPQQKESVKKRNSDAIDGNFVDFSKRQSDPVKLNLPDITPDPQDINDIEKEQEREVESADYESNRLEDEDEDEEGRMAYNSNDEGEQSADNNWEDNEDTTAEGGEQLSPAEKIYGAHVHVDEEEEEENGEDRSQSDPFLGLGDESEEKYDENAESNDFTRGGLRGSNSAKDPFGRQEETGNIDEMKEEEDKEQEVVESSQDDPVNIMDNSTFYKNQSPLEMPTIEDESIKSAGTKSMEDEINDQDGTDAGNDVAIKKNETIVEDGAQIVDDNNNSEDFSSNGKAAFEAKYGNTSKSMEEELNAQVALESDEVNNQSPLEVPIAGASGATGLNQTEVGESAQKDNSGLSMEKRLGSLHKSMAGEVDKEEGFGVEKNETVVKSMKNDGDVDEESKVNDEEKDEFTTDKHDSELADNTDADTEIDKGASSETNFKEYVITNSEDEPNKNEQNSEDLNLASEKSADIEDNLVVKDGDDSKDNEIKELSTEEKAEVEGTDEAVKDNGESVGDDVDEDSKAAKNVDDKKSEDDSQEVEMDLGDNEAVASLNQTLASNAGESADAGAEEKVEEPDQTLKIINGDNSKDDEIKELGTEEKGAEDTDEFVKANGSSDTSVQGDDVDGNSKAKNKSEDDAQEADLDLGDNEAVASLNGTLTSDAGEIEDSGAEDEEKEEEPDQSLKIIKGSNDASEPGEDADKDIKDDKTAETFEHGDDVGEDSKPKKKALIRGTAVDKKSKDKLKDDMQKVEKDEELNLSSTEVVQANKDDENIESVAEEEEEVIEGNDEPLKNKGSKDASEQGDKATKDSKAKKAESIRGASAKKSSKAKDNADGAIDVEGEKTAADKTANKSEDASGMVDDADEESKVKSNGDSEDESQELKVDLGDEALPSNRNKTLGQIDESEEASESVEEAEVSRDNKEGDANVDSKKVKKEKQKKKRKKTSIISSLGSIFKESDAGKDENIEAKASELVESEEIADETTAQNKDTKSLEGASKDKNHDESDSTEKVKVEDDIKYAKAASDSKEAGDDEQVSDKKEPDEQDKVKKSEVKKSISEEGKAIPILGDLGEAIKESDATLDYDEAITDKKDGVESSKLDSEATQAKPSNGKGDKDEETVSQKKSDEKIDVVAGTKEPGVGKDKTAKKDKKRKEKK